MSDRTRRILFISVMRGVHLELFRIQCAAAVEVQFVEQLPQRICAWRRARLLGGATGRFCVACLSIRAASNHRCRALSDDSRFLLAADCFGLHHVRVGHLHARPWPNIYSFSCLRRNGDGLTGEGSDPFLALKMHGKQHNWQATRKTVSR
jgi:hypothetical protein